MASQLKKQPRREWPELVGKTGEEAREVILATGAAAGVKDVEIVPEDAMVTADFRTDRVRVFVDGSGKVARTPTIG